MSYNMNERFPRILLLIIISIEHYVYSVAVGNNYNHYWFHRFSAHVSHCFSTY